MLIGLASSTLRLTTSQPLSLLSMARLNIARSRMRPSTWSLVRIDQTAILAALSRPDSTPVCIRVNRRDRPGSSTVWHSLAPPYQGHAHLSQDRQPTCRPAPAGPPENRKHCSVSRHRGGRCSGHRRAGGCLNYLGRDGVIGRPSLWIAEDIWVLRFRLMVKRGPLL
jgi:hypothetical protein